ncbi:MAG: hypothetical protein NUV57_02360 [archaeon]|nr:hypothetical protein [archaeon]
MKKIYSIFLIYLFIFPMLGFATITDSPAITADSSAAFADSPTAEIDPRILVETPEETALREQGTPTPQPTPAVEQVNEYVCDSSQLSPEESQGIIDLLKNGFTGNEIAGDTNKNSERDELATNELVLIDPSDVNSAVKTEIPNKKFDPIELSQFLNSYIDGPFAFGVVLEDSLRTGRCASYNEECTLIGPNLKYRNSGVGIVSDLKPVKEVFTDFFDGNKNLSQFSNEENEVLRTALITDTTLNDDGSIEESQIKTAKRLETDLIANSILTDQFDARMQTNCNNSSCVISTYSLFDKYFNSWMSSEMVVSTFGPSLLYETKKLFGWTGRRGFLMGVRDSYQEFLDRFRKDFITPESFLGKLKAKRVQNSIDKYGWRDWFHDLTGGSSDGSGYHLMKTEEFQTWWGKAQAKGGWLEGIKTAEEKAELIKVFKNMRSVLRAAETRNNVARESYETALKVLGENNPVTKQKYIEYGQDTVKWMDGVYDELFGADYIEWMSRHPNAGFYNKGVLQVRPGGDSEVISLFHEHRNLQRILKKFGEDGSFENFATPQALAEYGSGFQNSGDDLIYYVFDRENRVNYRGLSYSNLERAATGQRDTFALTDYGEYIPYTQQSVPFIQNRMGANAALYEGNWKQAGVLTPADITARITNARTGPTANMKFGTLNTQQMIDTLQERNWVSRRYWNSLDKLMAQEDELVRGYFTVKGGAKWTTVPFGYWWAKKGFGIEGVSQYQLPDTWHDLKFTHGSENIYDFAYIDFFANEGSDQGDLFIQVINKLPWKLILDELSEKFNPVKNLYDSLTKNELRNETEDLAFYLTGPEECVNCSMVLRSSNDLTEFKPFFFVEDKQLVSYILEDTRSEEARAKGQTLIAFAGHTNLVGQSGREEGEPIDLVAAIREEDIKTCSEAIQELNFYGMNFGKYLPEAVTENGRIGAVLGSLESVTYGVFFWAGIFSTAAIQIVVAPQLHGCVDVDEGYYAHYFAPAQTEEDSETDSSVQSTEKVSQIVDNFRDTFVQGFESDQNTFTKDAAEELGAEIDKFVRDSKENDIVQATLTMNGLSSGQIDSRTLFYFWCGPGCEINAANYKTEGKEQIRGTNGSNVDIDFKKGEISVDGVPIVQSEDNVRLASTNLNIPAIEIPKTVTVTCLENTTEVVVEINAHGEVNILNSDLLNCIRQGVLEQTGLPMDSGTMKLNDVFGPLEVVVTSTHPNVKFFDDKIIAEGIPRKVAEGSNAKLSILANKDVNLSVSNDGETSLGKLESIQFANGSIVVKPDGCFLTWLKHHEDGKISKDLVKGIKSDLDRELNPVSQCEEPAIDFSLLGNSDSPRQADDIAKFNESLQHMGPFQIFETPTQRFVISAEEDENGACIDHLRVIDKETGEVTDYTGNITKTPDGFKITTPDGETHEVAFSTKDGAPIVQFDENKPELLTAAQGKNGSFYYDPEKGIWFAENAQLLPLIEAFREGIAAKVGPNGEVTATASGNALTVNLGGDDSGFLNLPSLPEEKILLVLILGLLVATFVIVQRRN